MNRYTCSFCRGLTPHITKQPACTKQNPVDPDLQIYPTFHQSGRLAGSHTRSCCFCHRIGLGGCYNCHDDKLTSTTFKLAEVLCNIVSNRYSHDEKLRTLERQFKWANTKFRFLENSPSIFLGSKVSGLSQENNEGRKLC